MGRREECVRYNPGGARRGADNRGFRSGRVLDQYTLDFWSCDIDAATNNEIVVAALIVKEAIAVTNIDVAGNIPTVAHIVALLSVKVQISAAGRAFDGK